MVKKIEFINFRKKKTDDDKKNKKIPQISIMSNTPQNRKFSIKRIFFWILIIFLISLLVSSIEEKISPKLAIVELTGEISSSDSGGIYSTDIVNKLELLKQDSTIKAIILDINSPGGSPVASSQISKKIEEVKKIKPVYAYINDYSFSGGVWIMVSANKTYSDKLSLTGSIGVTSAKLGFEDLIKDFNITYRRQVAGEYKDIGSVFKKPTIEENKIIQNILDGLHKEFISHISISKNISYEEVERFSNGEIFLGSKAKELGLVDEILTKDELIKKIRKDFNNENLKLVYYNNPKSLLQELGFNGIDLNLNVGNENLQFK